MPLLEKLVEDKLLRDIVDLIRPIEEKELEDPFYLRHHLLVVLLFEIDKKEFGKQIHKIKLEYYKRNLAILELILEKQNTSENLRLALKIVKENLSFNNISSTIPYHKLYHTYRNRELYTYSPGELNKQFILYEPQEYHKIESFIRSLNLSEE